MKLECNLVNKVSKAGNPYTSLRIQLLESPPVFKDVFVTDSEIALLQLNT